MRSDPISSFTAADYIISKIAFNLISLLTLTSMSTVLTSPWSNFYIADMISPRVGSPKDRFVFERHLHLVDNHPWKSPHLLVSHLGRLKDLLSCDLLSDTNSFDSWTETNYPSRNQFTIIRHLCSFQSSICHFFFLTFSF